MQLDQGGRRYLQLTQDRMVLNAGEQDSHGIGAIVQVGDSRAVQVAGQLINVGLELGKCYESAVETGRLRRGTRAGEGKAGEDFVKEEGRAWGVRQGGL